jgi:uncharacterized protein
MTSTGKTVKAFRWCWVGVVSLLMAAPVWAGPAEDNAAAEKEFARGNLVVAMPLWKKAAEAGYAPAQVWLGEILDKGEEDEQAVEWYRKAAAQGDAAGEYGLGGMYAKGEGVKKDFEQARLYFQRAAEKDFLIAVRLMRDMYKDGLFGISRDAAQAEKWEARLKEVMGKDYVDSTAAPVAEAPGKKKRKR